MLKKIRNVFLLLIILVSAGLISGCCAMKKINVEVVFINAHEELGLENYSESIKYGEGISFELEVPVGYDHEGLKVTYNQSEVVWDEDDVVYEDPKFKEEINQNYRYTTKKTISISVNRIIKDSTINVDLTEVTRRGFDLEIASDILNTTGTFVNNHMTDSNLSVVSIDPSSIGRLVKVDPSIVLAERPVEGNKATVYYGEYIILCYVKPSTTSAEISTIYSRPNYFTNEEDILYYGDTAYLQYDVAKKGNAYYNLYRCANPATSSRLYYIGLIEEGYTLQKTIPDYVTSSAMTMEDDYNKFSLLTNLNKYNSDLLSIEVYKPTQNNTTGVDSILDNGSQVELELATPISANTLYPNNNLYNRYERYDMYIGNNKATDSLLTAEEKTNLPNKLYISISSTIVDDDLGLWGDELEDYLNFHFLHYEKQSNTVSHISVENLVTSSSGAKFLIIDRELIESYINPKVYSGTNTEYETGNAILYVEMDVDYIRTAGDRDSSLHQFPYAFFDSALYLNGEYVGYNRNYTMDFYVVGDNDERTYGFVDKHCYGEDRVFFRIEDIFESDGTFKNNLFVDIQGMDYNSFYAPIITTVKITKNYDALVVDTISITNQATFNGIKSLLVNLKEAEVGKQQYRLHMYLSVSEVKEGAYDVSFSNIDFGNNNTSDAIYITNDVTFVDDTSFFRLSNMTKDYDSDVRFGANSDIFYFVATDEPLDFDIYKIVEKEVDGETVTERHLISGTKQLKDICGNPLKIYLNSGKECFVYVKYQIVDIYEDTQVGYNAYNN